VRSRRRGMGAGGPRWRLRCGQARLVAEREARLDPVLPLGERFHGGSRSGEGGVARRGEALDGSLRRGGPIEALIDVFLLSLLVIVAVAIAQVRNLLAAVMLTGIYSLLSASWMLVLDAPDVAYTEAAVG